MMWLNTSCDIIANQDGNSEFFFENFPKKMTKNVLDLCYCEDKNSQNKDLIQGKDLVQKYQLILNYWAFHVS